MSNKSNNLVKQNKRYRKLRDYEVMAVNDIMAIYFGHGEYSFCEVVEGEILLGQRVQDCIIRPGTFALREMFS